MATQEFLFGPEAEKLPPADVVLQRLGKTRPWHRIDDHIQRIPGMPRVAVRFMQHHGHNETYTKAELEDKAVRGQRHMGALALAGEGKLTVPSQRCFVHRMEVRGRLG